MKDLMKNQTPVISFGGNIQDMALILEGFGLIPLLETKYPSTFILAWEHALCKSHLNIGIGQPLEHQAEINQVLFYVRREQSNIVNVYHDLWRLQILEDGVHHQLEDLPRRFQAKR